MVWPHRSTLVERWQRGNNAIGSGKGGNEPNCGRVAQGEARNKGVKNFLYAEYIKRIEEQKCFHCN